LQTITNAGSAQETRDLGKKFAGSLKPGDVIALFGQLGSGKTTFIQGLSKGLGIDNFVTSPSFVIINEYPLNNRGQKTSFFHIDLYRMDSAGEIEDLGITDLFNDRSIVAIEWAEKAGMLLPENCKKVHFNFVSENEREVVFS